jgi:hypothetical protein
VRHTTHHMSYMIAVAAAAVAVAAAFSAAAAARAAAAAAAWVEAESVPMSAPEGKLVLWQRSYNFTSAVSGRSFPCHGATVEDARFIGVRQPLGSCYGPHYRTSDTAADAHCVYATNGGFFSSGSPFCIGDLVQNGTVLQIAADARAKFGVLKGQPPVLIAGVLRPDEIGSGQQFSQLIQGLGWIVRAGKSNVNSTSDLNPTSGFVTEKAPRTGVGFFANGSAALFQCDGIELKFVGPDLFEFAEAAIDYGIHSLINLDGGGSSVSVYDGQVISAPTCDDTGTICERAVASITCVYDTPVN